MGNNAVVSRSLQPFVISNLTKNRTKSRFPLQVERRNFTPEFSESPIFGPNFRFPWRSKKTDFII